jgi:hypothetical protein
MGMVLIEDRQIVLKKKTTTEFDSIVVFDMILIRNPFALANGIGSNLP